MNSFLVEAATQGKVLRDCLDFYTRQSDTPLDAVVSEFKTINYRNILFAGMGSSYYAAFAVTDYLTQNGYPSHVLNAYEVSRYQLGLVTPETLLIAISQSGKTKEVLELVNKVKDRKSVIAVVNREDSMLSQMADIQVWIKAGIESQISNKSYLCTLAVLNLLASDLLGQLDSELVDALYKLADWIDNFFSNLSKYMLPLEEFVQGATNYDFIANGPSFSSAFQAGLIFREGPKLITCTSNCADYAHGWDKSAKPGYIGVMHSPQYDPESVDARMVNSLIEKGGQIVLLTEKDVQSSDKMYVIRHPKLPERLAPLAQITVTSALMGWLMGEKSDRE